MSVERVMLQNWASTSEKLDRLNRTLREYQEKLEEARELTGINYDGMPHGTSVSNPTERKAMMALHIDETYQLIFTDLLRSIYEAMETKRKVDKVLQNLPPICERICWKRYGEGLRWWMVAEECGISEEYAKHLHTAILRLIREENNK